MISFANNFRSEISGVRPKEEHKNVTLKMCRALQTDTEEKKEEEKKEKNKKNFLPTMSLAMQN